MSQFGPWNQYPGATPPVDQGPVWTTPPSQTPRPSWQPVTWSDYPSMPTYQSSAYPPTPAYPPPTTSPVFPPAAYPPTSYPPSGTAYPPSTYPTTTPVPWATFPAPRPRKSKLPSIIVSVVMFVVVGPIISSFFSSLNEADFVPTTTRPTATRATYPPRSTWVPQASGTVATRPPVTQSPGGYVPGPPDLHPDDPPMPNTYSEIDQMLLANPLYAQTLPTTDCAIADIDLVNATTAEIERPMNAFVDCLMAAWSPPVRAAGFTLPHPSVTVYTAETTSPCGQLPLYNAIYCSADQQIYYAANFIQAFPWNLQMIRFLAESVIAHEFGHAVQYRTMILMSEAILENDASTDFEEMEYSRRLEMQADCFAGVFLDAITASSGMTTVEEDAIVLSFRSLGGTDPYSDDHGTGDNRAYWVTQGLNSTTPGVCGTFAAESRLVA